MRDYRKYLYHPHRRSLESCLTDQCFKGKLQIGISRGVGVKVGIQIMKLSQGGVQIFSGTTQYGSHIYASENVLLSKWFQRPNSTPQAKKSQRYYTTSTPPSGFKHRFRWMMLHFNCHNIQWVLKSLDQCTTSITESVENYI